MRRRSWRDEIHQLRCHQDRQSTAVKWGGRERGDSGVARMDQRPVTAEGHDKRFGYDKADRHLHAGEVVIRRPGGLMGQSGQLRTTGAKALLPIVIGAQFFCGSAEVTACSRMVYAFSRDNALPGSATWRRVSSRRVPVPAVWLSVAVAFVVAVPSMWNAAAYGAVTAVNVIGMTPSYIVPVYLRLRQRDHFVPGPWNLGRCSRPVGIAAVAWVVVLTVLVCLPQRYPVTMETFNYAPITLLVVLALAALWRLAGKRFSVPVVQDPQLAAVEKRIV